MRDIVITVRHPARVPLVEGFEGYLVEIVRAALSPHLELLLGKYDEAISVAVHPLGTSLKPTRAATRHAEKHPTIRQCLCVVADRDRLTRALRGLFAVFGSVLDAPTGREETEAVERAKHALAGARPRLLRSHQKKAKR